MSTQSIPTPGAAETPTNESIEKGGASVGKPPRHKRRYRLHRTNWWATALVAVLSLTILVPLYFAVVTAFKTAPELAESGFGLPNQWNLDNFVEAWRLTEFPKRLMTSAIITVGAVIVTLFTNSMVAYAIARNLHRKSFKFLYYF
ncbi:MAG: carbohydrate ABC transporter permease, partial [Dermabacter sp.]|nr:carbohydrate ABC transporter permease [Dermabacter sp.]